MVDKGLSPFHFFWSMKKIMIGLIALTVLGCNQLDTKKSKVKQAKIVELVLWKSKEGINNEKAKQAIAKQNDFGKYPPDFVARKTGLAEDGMFLDIAP
jgi:hypothetical protein